MAINGRRKGARAERQLAALFTKWSGLKFSRTPSSGGLNWKAAHTKGDIVCTEEGHYFPFCIEAKFHNNVNFEHLLYLPVPEIMKFWSQCSRDAQKANKMPLLFIRYNGLPKNFWFIMLKADDYKAIHPRIRPGKYFKVFSTEIYVIMTPQKLFGSDYKALRKLVLTKYPKTKK